MATRFAIEITNADASVTRTVLDVAQVEMCQRERGNQVADWVRLQTTEVLANADQWTSGRIGRMYMLEGEGEAEVATLLFTGKFVNPNAFTAWKGQGKRYLLKGPWERFERTPYVQPWTAYTEVSGVTTVTKFARVFLWTDEVTSSDQVGLVVDYLLADGAGIASMLQFQKGNIDGGIKLRPAKAQSMMCSEVVLQSLRLTNDAACWFDYSFTPPKFHCRRGGVREGVSYGNLEQWTQPVYQESESFTASRLDELAIRYVRIALKRQEQPPPPETPRGLVTIVPGAPGLGGVVTFATLHELGPVGAQIPGTIAAVGLVMPPEVNGPVTLGILSPTTARVNVFVTTLGVGGHFIPDSEPLRTILPDVGYPLPLGSVKYGGIDVAYDEVDLFDEADAQELAQLIYELNSVAPWAGQHVIGRLETGVRPGMLYNVSGSRADYAAMNGIVQSVVDDFARRTTTVTWGPPKQLAPQDLLERLRAMRDALTPVSPEELGEQETGTSAGPTYGFKKDQNSPGGTNPTMPAAPDGDGPFVLGAKNKVLGWLQSTTDCA